MGCKQVKINSSVQISSLFRGNYIWMLYEVISLWMSKNKESSKYGSVDDRTYINMDEILKAWPHNYCLLPLKSTICVILGRLSRSNMTVYI